MDLCQMCRGACCEEIFISVEPRDFFDEEWLEARLGPCISRRLARRAPGAVPGMELILESRCPKLTEDGLCSIHGEENGQPTACRLADVLGNECLGSIRRRRPMLWEDLGLDEGHRS